MPPRVRARVDQLAGPDSAELRRRRERPADGSPSRGACMYPCDGLKAVGGGSAPRSGAVERSVGVMRCEGGVTVGGWHHV